MARDIRLPVTPPINTAGIYTCYAPYELPTDTVYFAEAIRTFPELERRDRAVYDEFYEPFGLSEEIYEEDAKRFAAIVTLRAADGELRFVPNTFIESYPGMTGLKYSRNVIIADVGMIPSTIDLNLLAGDVESVIVKHTGVDTTMHVDTMGYDGDISHEQHVELEIARKARIRQHVPLEILLQESEQRNARLTEANQELMGVLSTIKPVSRDYLWEQPGERSFESWPMAVEHTVGTWPTPDPTAKRVAPTADFAKEGAVVGFKKDVAFTGSMLKINTVEDDSVRIFVDGVLLDLVVSNDYPPFSHTGVKPIVPGVHTIAIELTNDKSGCYISFAVWDDDTLVDVSDESWHCRELNPPEEV